MSRIKKNILMIVKQRRDAERTIMISSFHVTEYHRDIIITYVRN